MSQKDCRIEFKDAMPTLNESQKLVLQSTPAHTVVLSAIAAKELLTMLSEQIESYEKQYGPIANTQMTPLQER
jgi:hypothetical protein